MEVRDEYGSDRLLKGQSLVYRRHGVLRSMLPAHVWTLFQRQTNCRPPTTPGQRALRIPGDVSQPPAPAFVAWHAHASGVRSSTPTNDDCHQGTLRSSRTPWRVATITRDLGVNPSEPPADQGNCCSDDARLKPASGFEPLTSSLRGRRSVCRWLRSVAPTDQRKPISTVSPPSDLRLVLHARMARRVE